MKPMRWKKEWKRRPWSSCRRAGRFIPRPDRLNCAASESDRVAKSSLHQTAAPVEFNVGHGSIRFQSGSSLDAGEYQIQRCEDCAALICEIADLPAQRLSR